MRSSLLYLVATLGLFACNASHPTGAAPSASTTVDAGDDEDAATIGCENDSRVTVLAPGTEAKSPSGKLVATLVSATPSPPQRGVGDDGINRWVVNLTLDGEPETGTVTASTWMPDHRHGSPTVPVVTPNPDGSFTVDSLFLFMGGVWQISLVAGPETATFSICVE